MKSFPWFIPLFWSNFDAGYTLPLCVSFEFQLWVHRRTHWLLWGWLISWDWVIWCSSSPLLWSALTHSISSIFPNRWYKPCSWCLPLCLWFLSGLRVELWCFWDGSWCARGGRRCRLARNAIHLLNRWNLFSIPRASCRSGLKGSY